MIRELEPGSKELIWARISEDSGADLSSVGVELCVTTADAPGTWASPDDTDTSTPGVLRAAALFTAPASGPLYYNVFARVTDSPEVTILRCGSFKVR